MPFLRQSTSQTIRFGPCLDKTDGVTEETALTLAQADMRLSKDGAAFAQKNAAGNATHDSDGWYSTTLNTTDTNTVGELILNVHQPANMLPVWMRWWVLEEAIYDDIFGASAGGYLKPTTAGRTLDVSAGGEAGIDWANIGSPTTAQTLSSTTIGTVTANTDMRGTDSALLAASAPTNFGDLAITATTGRVTVGTNNDKTGYSLTQGFPTNFADLAITATTGLVDITQTAADKVWSTGTRNLTALGFTYAAGDFGAASLNGKGDWNTGKTGYALSAAGISSILTTQMTEAYAADGVAPTVAQALFAILQQAGEFAISGTTITVKKLDGSTTAMTFTLDDAANPTSRTRAT